MFIGMKKLLIALLSINAILIALLTAQSVQSAPKTYDAVKLAQYSACLQTGEGSDWVLGYIISRCVKYKP